MVAVNFVLQGKDFQRELQSFSKKAESPIKVDSTASDSCTYTLTPPSPGTKQASLLRGLHTDLNYYIKHEPGYNSEQDNELLVLCETLEAILGGGTGDGKIEFLLRVPADLDTTIFSTLSVIKEKACSGEVNGNFVTLAFSNPPMPAEITKIKAFVAAVEGAYKTGTTFDPQKAKDALNIDLFNFYNVFCKYVLAEEAPAPLPEAAPQGATDTDVSSVAKIEALRTKFAAKPDEAKAAGTTTALIGALSSKDLAIKKAAIVALGVIYKDQLEKAASHGVVTALVPISNSSTEDAGVKTAARSAVTVIGTTLPQEVPARATTPPYKTLYAGKQTVLNLLDRYRGVSSAINDYLGAKNAGASDLSTYAGLVVSKIKQITEPVDRTALLMELWKNLDEDTHTVLWTDLEKYIDELTIIDADQTLSYSASTGGALNVTLTATPARIGRDSFEWANPDCLFINTATDQSDPSILPPVLSLSDKVLNLDRASIARRDDSDGAASPTVNLWYIDAAGKFHVGKVVFTQQVVAPPPAVAIVPTTTATITINPNNTGTYNPKSTSYSVLWTGPVPTGELVFKSNDTELGGWSGQVRSDITAAGQMAMLTFTAQGRTRGDRTNGDLWNFDVFEKTGSTEKKVQIYHITFDVKEKEAVEEAAPKPATKPKAQKKPAAGRTVPDDEGETK